ncbi:PPOX class F420-dependent oxidoreductase [Nonomuraea helvata]|uniref:PPOX class F420-dependent oxidoreductase n=1 Tax=Nonomuraea helvata TaxID=37484 RepID=A0ABV5SCH2_9ACTN
MILTRSELDYLATQPIGRLATVSPDGQVQNNPTNFVVDDLATLAPWRLRSIEIRGTAVALTDQEPPLPSLSREIIRIIPVKIVTWGLDGPRATRTV